MLNEEAAQVLSIASEILSKGVPLEEIRGIGAQGSHQDVGDLDLCCGQRGVEVESRRMWTTPCDVYLRDVRRTESQAYQSEAREQARLRAKQGGSAQVAL